MYLDCFESKQPSAKQQGLNLRIQEIPNMFFSSTSFTYMYFGLQKYNAKTFSIILVEAVR